MSVQQGRFRAGLVTIVQHPHCLLLEEDDVLAGVRNGRMARCRSALGCSHILCCKVEWWRTEKLDARGRRCCGSQAVKVRGA
jgi:hypothetical protein